MEEVDGADNVGKLVIMLDERVVGLERTVMERIDGVITAEVGRCMVAEEERASVLSLNPIQYQSLIPSLSP